MCFRAQERKWQFKNTKQVYSLYLYKSFSIFVNLYRTNVLDHLDQPLRIPTLQTLREDHPCQTKGHCRTAPNFPTNKKRGQIGKAFEKSGSQAFLVIFLIKVPCNFQKGQNLLEAKLPKSSDWNPTGGVWEGCKANMQNTFKNSQLECSPWRTCSIFTTQWLVPKCWGADIDQRMYSWQLDKCVVYKLTKVYKLEHRYLLPRSFSPGSVCFQQFQNRLLSRISWKKFKCSFGFPRL